MLAPCFDVCDRPTLKSEEVYGASIGAFFRPFCAMTWFVFAFAYGYSGFVLVFSVFVLFEIG